MVRVNNMTVRIVLLDDQPVVGDGIRFALRPSEGIALSEIVGNLSELLPALQRHRPDVLVTEVRAGGEDVLRFYEQHMGNVHWPPAIAYSAESNPSHIARAAALGFQDYLLKTTETGQVLEAIRRAARGEPAPEDSLMIQTRRQMRRPRQQYDHDIPLTNREMQVLRHLAKGLSNREIGRSLKISVETVKEHVQNILRKLDVADRTQAAVWAVRRKLD